MKHKHLNDALSGLDQRYIDEAASLRAGARGKSSEKAYVIQAAALAAALLLIFGTIGLIVLKNGSGRSVGSQPDGEILPAESGGEDMTAGSGTEPVEAPAESMAEAGADGTSYESLAETTELTDSRNGGETEPESAEMIAEETAVSSAAVSSEYPDAPEALEANVRRQGAYLFYNVTYHNTKDHAVVLEITGLSPENCLYAGNFLNPNYDDGFQTCVSSEGETVNKGYIVSGLGKTPRDPDCRCFMTGMPMQPLLPGEFYKYSFAVKIPDGSQAGFTAVPQVYACIWDVSVPWQPDASQAFSSNTVMLIDLIKNVKQAAAPEIFEVTDRLSYTLDTALNPDASTNIAGRGKATRAFITPTLLSGTPTAADPEGTAAENIIKYTVTYDNTSGGDESVRLEVRLDPALSFNSEAVSALNDAAYAAVDSALWAEDPSMRGVCSTEYGLTFSESSDGTDTASYVTCVRKAPFGVAPGEHVEFSFYVSVAPGVDPMSTVSELTTTVWPSDRYLQHLGASVLLEPSSVLTLETCWPE